MRTLQKFGGNRRLTAATLGISLRTLQYRLKELGLLMKKVQAGNDTAGQSAE